MPADRPGLARAARAHAGSGQVVCHAEVLISERPAEADDRAVPGHWEGDLDHRAGQFRDRHPGRAHDAVHDAAAPAADGGPRSAGPREKNGPALAGHGAEAVRDAITRTITTLPEQLRRSLTWDQGAEMAQHAQLRIDTGLQVYFCDPHSPWQRGTNENTNGLLRQYFPKGTDLSLHARMTSPLSRQRSTADRARPLDGKRLPRLSTPCCDQFRVVLRRPAEPGQYTLLVSGMRRGRKRSVRPSTGSVRAIWDNAMAAAFLASLV